MNLLLIVSLVAPTIEEQRIRRFSEWMGVQTKTIIIGNKAEAAKQLLEDANSECCLAMSAETLAALYEASSQPSQLRCFFKDRCAAMLVFNCADSSQHGAALSWLTNGAARRVTLTADGVDGEKEFHMPTAGKAFSQQFAGLSFSVTRRVPQLAFELDANASGIIPIVLAKHDPAFICLQQATCRVFLLAGSEAPDIDEPLSLFKGIEESYDQVIPFVIFLRSCFGQLCWHSPKSTARFIIDDPLLADRYGLLDYSALLNSMSRQNYGTSIAFIPWNYRRTSQLWAASLLEKKANLSICVHGCDHTNREFDEPDEGVLKHKAGLALSRMEKHRQRTRIPFEPVMVFPQGKFSSSAILALRANNYLAAVNTSCFPTDYVQCELTIADFSRPAITRFHGFPIFQRHYPQRLIDFAFDMFQGKPVLLVEHHQYLEDGCKKLEEFVADLHRIEPALTWPSLTSQLTESCLVRRRTTESFDVKFFTRKFRLKNSHAGKCNFYLEKDEPDASAIQSVLVDGKTTPFRLEENFIRLEVEADEGQTSEIEIVDQARPCAPVKRLGVTYSFGVFFRRELSEFRDNTLSKHPAILKATREVAKRMKMTGDRKKEEKC